jgi:hypothetical protein
MEIRTIENPIIKDRVTFIRTSNETHGEVTEILVELAPGGGNEPHSYSNYLFLCLDGSPGDPGNVV